MDTCSYLQTKEEAKAKVRQGEQVFNRKEWSRMAATL